HAAREPGQHLPHRLQLDRVAAVAGKVTVQVRLLAGVVAVGVRAAVGYVALEAAPRVRTRDLELALALVDAARDADVAAHGVRRRLEIRHDLVAAVLELAGRLQSRSGAVP